MTTQHLGLREEKEEKESVEGGWGRGGWKIKQIGSIFLNICGKFSQNFMKRIEKKSNSNETPKDLLNHIFI